MLQAVMSRLKGRRGRPCIEVDEPEVILPGSPSALSVSQLSTYHLRDVALQAAIGPVTKSDRPSLLAIAHSQVKAWNDLSWDVQTAESPTPCRSQGILFSYNNELYMLGGWDTTMYLNLNTDPNSELWVEKGEQFLMRLDSKTHRWQSEESAGLPTTRPWDPYHYLAFTGAVCQDKLYVVCSRNVFGSIHDMRIFDFSKKEWTGLKLNVNPPAVHRPFINAHGSSLLLFGGGINYMWQDNWVQPEKALWSFDTMQQEWQHRQPTGPLPPPERCCGMCVVEEQAYVLVNTPSNDDPDGRMIVFVLDLQTWHWTELPAHEKAPPCALNFTPVVIQGYWLVFGGSGDAEPSEDLHLFDFATFSWSTAQQPLLQKPAGYLATCHQDRMVIMGGYGEGEVADLIQTICPRYRPPAEAEADSSSMRYELSNDLRESLQQREFTDLTIQVEGKRWEVHRVVLASCSPFFKQVMQCGPAPGEPLELTGLDAEGVELLIEWVYGTFKPSLAYKQRLSLFHASHRFHVSELQLECERALKNSVSLQTYPELADLARRFNCQELEQACNAFLARMESNSDTSEGVQELQARCCWAQVSSEASSSPLASSSLGSAASEGLASVANSKSHKCKSYAVEIDLDAPEYGWHPADEAVRSSVTGHLSNDIDAKDAVVTQPSAKECNSFPVDIEDDCDDEEEDSDADVSSDMEEESTSSGSEQVLEMAGEPPSPSRIPSAHAAIVSQEKPQELGEGISLAVVPQDEQQGEQQAAGGDDQPDMPATQQHTLAPLQDLGLNSGSTSGQHAPSPASRGWSYKVLYAVGQKVDSARAIKRNWFRPKRSYSFDDESI